MAKKIFKKWLPNPTEVKNNPSLKYLGNWVHNPNLWHLNRHTVAGAFAVGLFTAFLPIPLQMLIAGILAVLFKVNLPIAVALVWLTNPLTIPPMFYFAYRLGTFMLDIVPQKTNFEMSFEWFTTVLSQIWQPLILGSMTLSIIAASLGYCAIHIFWRWRVHHAWLKRKEQRQLRKKADVEAALTK